MRSTDETRSLDIGRATLSPTVLAMVKKTMMHLISTIPKYFEEFLDILQVFPLEEYVILSPPVSCLYYS